MSETVLITGASGFVGSRLAARLANMNYEVHVIVRLSSNLWRINEFKNKLQLHLVDLENFEQIKQAVNKINPGIIFHLACYGGFANEGDENRVLTINTLATYHLLKAAAMAKTKKFIYVGSSSEYGPKTEIISENDLERPSSIYGVSKLAGSQLVRLFADKGIFSAAILRIFSPYGMFDDQRRLIPMIIKACLHKKQLPLGSGTQVRDYFYVEDLVDAFVLTMEKNIAGSEIINLGSGQQRTVREVVDFIVKAIGDCNNIPLWGVLPDNKNEPISWCSNNSKARNLLGWEPTTSINDGLKKTIVWMRENIHFYEG